MKNIIIVGTGKAAYLHYIKYKKLGYENICFLDNKITNTYIDSTNIYYSIDEIFNNEIDPKETVVDICTPCSVFMDVINNFIKKGIINFIVEKPFVVPDNYFVDKENINFIMMENFRYSLITRDMMQILNDLKLDVKSIRIEFSKDRIKDSFSKRGISASNIPTCFEIEMPHQIYMADHFVSEGEKEYKIIELRDMEHDGEVLPKHGFGLIKYVRNGIDITLVSDLTKGPNVRRVEIEFTGGKMLGNYLNYDVLFNRESTGSLEIIMGDVTRKINYNTDDNMYYSLKHYLKDLDEGSNMQEHKEEILNFSKSLSYAINRDGLIESEEYTRKIN